MAYRSAVTAAFMVWLASALLGCTTGGDVLGRASESDLALRAGTAEYIQRDAVVAERLIGWTTDVLAVLEGDPIITLDRLYDEAQTRIPWERLSPGQQVLAEDLLVVVERRIRAEVDAGVLAPGAVHDLRAVLRTIQRQAERERRLGGS